MASRKRRFPALTTRSIASFFSTNKEAVDSEMEEKESKDNESDEEVTDKSQKPNSSRYEKKFNTRWLNDYGWLKHDNEKGMLCNCVSALGNSPLLLLDAQTSELRRSQDTLRAVSTEMRY